MVNKLIDIIGREAALFESFLELLEKQQRYLVENDVDGLHELTDRQRELMVASQLLNKERLSLIGIIKAQQAIEGDLSVSRLLELVDKNQADRLSELKRVILDLNEKINETRNQNAVLLNRSREYIHKTMDMLSRINTSETVYTASGKGYNKRQTVAVDRSV